LKRIYILLLCALAGLQAKAQTNYYKLSVGAGAGAAVAFGDLKNEVVTPAVYAAADYYFSPYIAVGLEGQLGKLKGGDTALYHANFSNSYKAGNLNARVSAGAFMKKRFVPNTFNTLIRGFYVGTGIGLLRNNITERYPTQNNNPRINQGKRSSWDALVPVNIGLNYGFKEKNGYERLTVNLNFQSNFTFGEGMDGFDDNPLFSPNTNSDIYIFSSVGIKYKFGRVGYYKR
jgi:hypothetical protein